jgi:hypothetical protein
MESSQGLARLLTDLEPGKAGGGNQAVVVFIS